tara:strand:+ start:706 stop:1386 length:681 start_codon:yes stop_codon:yes gene_type:complete
MNKDTNRIGWEELINRDKSKAESFQKFDSCLTVEHRELFDDTSKTMNSLNEEVVNLRRKTKEIDSKNTEIDNLNKQLKDMYLELEKIKKKTNKNFELETKIIELNKNNHTIDEKDTQITKLKSEIQSLHDTISFNNITLNKLENKLAKYKQIIENDEINKELKIELNIVKKQLHDLQIKHNLKVNVSQLSKKFNEKVIHLVLEKYEVEDGDLIDIGKFRQIIKDMI